MLRLHCGVVLRLHGAQLARGQVALLSCVAALEPALKSLASLLTPQQARAHRRRRHGLLSVSTVLGVP